MGEALNFFFSNLLKINQIDFRVWETELLADRTPKCLVNQKTFGMESVLCDKVWTCEAISWCGNMKQRVWGEHGISISNQLLVDDDEKYIYFILF